MMPLTQVPGDNECLRVAIASLFELPLHEVPFFGGKLAFDTDARNAGRYGLLQDRELGAWLEERGLARLYVTRWRDDDGDVRASPTPPWGMCIASGPTVRGTHHAVVWDCNAAGDSNEFGRMLHDPHPSGAGLVEVHVWTCFTIRDPALYARWQRERIAAAIEGVPTHTGGTAGPKSPTDLKHEILTTIRGA